MGIPCRVIIEGAKLTVCSNCSRHGKLTWEEEPKPKPATKLSKSIPFPRIKVKKMPTTPTETMVELVEDYDSKIKQAREKLGLTHDDLGRRLNEKISLLRKIETKKMAPDNMLAARLEHALKIKLIVPAAEEKMKDSPKVTASVERKVTLGDLIRLNKKDEGSQEGSAERKRS